MDEIEVIESKVYSVDGKQVTFSVELIPSNMKWIPFFFWLIESSSLLFFSFWECK